MSYLSVTPYIILILITIHMLQQTIMLSIEYLAINKK